MIVRVGLGSCGIAAGGKKVLNIFKQLAEEYNVDIEVKTTGCIGMCFYEPIVDIVTKNNSTTYGYVDELLAKEIFKSHIMHNEVLEDKIIYTSENPNEYKTAQKRIVLENCGVIDPESLQDYLINDGYIALNKVLTLTPKQVIEEIKISGLRGRGGAGFPTWFKWEAASKNEGEKFIVCNADEGDPGAFMDRSIIEGDPHKLIEGMIISGYAIGANKGIIYCRAEYPLAIERLEIAISQALNKKFLGDNILGSDFCFHLSIKMGAGAFVCGEETALIESLEGKRGMPRIKPPFPAESGYWNKPTNINNVETFANVPWIINNGAINYSEIGLGESKGTKVFALSGKVKKGGLVEIPMGMTLREVIFDIGGGIKKDKEFKAVQLGGPSGGCIPASLLDTPVTYEDILATGAIMGSGGMVVMDEDTCMVDVAKFFLDFTCKESCGKCVHCRIGTKRMFEILERISKGKGKLEDLDELGRLADTIKDASLCGLGQSAPNPVITGLKYFKDEYLAHIVDKKCTSKSCVDLLTYMINDNCTGCTLCAKKCPVNCIAGKRKDRHTINEEKCINCGNCYNSCNFYAIEII